MCGLWIGMGLLGVILSCFVTNIRPEAETEVDKRTLVLKKLRAAISHVRKSRIQILLIPLSVFYGLSTAFLTADFTKVSGYGVI